MLENARRHEEKAAVKADNCVDAHWVLTPSHALCKVHRGFRFYPPLTETPEPPRNTVGKRLIRRLFVTKFILAHPTVAKLLKIVWSGKYVSIRSSTSSPLCTTHLYLELSMKWNCCILHTYEALYSSHLERLQLPQSLIT